MATLTGKLVSETYKALLKMIDNDILTESEKQISDGYGQGTGIFIDDNGFIRASVFKVTGGSSSQFLKADGSLDSNSYLTAASAAGLFLPIGSTTTVIPEGTNLYFTNARVLSAPLTGFVSTEGTVTAADTVLTAIDKIWWNIENGGGGGGGYVPYTGATQNLNLGTYGLISDYIQFNLAPTSIPTTAGTMSWNAADGTADLKMGGANVTLQVGQEELVRVVNKTGANLLEANYQAVRVSGAQGNRLKVALAKADNDANSADTIGLVTETINNNQEGFVTAVGLVRNIDTTGDLQTETWADGEMLYLSSTTAGAITNIKPEAPEHGVRLGYVVRAHKTQGQIYVKVDNGYELDELHNVLITDPVTQDILTYDEGLTGGLWINRNIWTAIGATEVGKSLLAILDAEDTTPVTTKPRAIRINVDNTVDALEVGTQGYLPFYDDTDFYIDSPVFTDGTDVVIGGDTPNGTNKLTVIGGIWGEELVLNDQFLLATNPIGGNYSFNIYDGTSWITQMVLSKTNLVFNISGYEKMRLNASGYLGVGIDTPTALIHAKGTTAYPKIKIDNASASGGGMFSAYQNGTEIANFGVSGAWLIDNSSDVAIVATKAGQGIQFFTNGSTSEKMGINSDGNVFIGQTPTFVAGATQLIVRGKTGAGFLGVNHYDMSIKGSINTFNSVFQVGTSTFHSVAVIVEDTERARFNSGGRFLLGTTTDNTTDIFQANGSIIATAIKKTGGTSTQYLMADGSVSTLASYVPTSRTLTINGTGYDLTADRSWSVGTVTSVSASVPTGFAISGSPITSAGTLAITFESGYALPTTVKQSNWDDAYTFVAAFPTQTGNAGKYLTTDGSSLSWGTVTAGVSSFNTRTGTVTLTSTDVTTALGYTPYNGTTNPNGYITSSALSGYVPTTRKLSINGTEYDLSADRAWTISAGSSARNVSTFTATAGQTTFTITGGYTVNLVDVYLNGARLTGVDYTATNGTTVVLTTGARINDIIDVVNYTASTTAGVTGSGTSGTLPIWTGTSALGNSVLTQSSGILSSAGGLIFGTYNTAFSTAGSITRHSTVGLVLKGVTGSVFDFAIYSPTETALITNPTGTNNINFNSGQVWFNGGNVGIGTTTPISYYNFARTLSIENANNAELQLKATGGTNLIASFGTADGGTYLQSVTQPIITVINGAERMRITSAGNVGIGTSSPTGTYGKLSVAGGISIIGDNNAKLEIGRYASFAPNSYIKLGANSDSLRITNNTDSADLVTFTNSGNVGIGTTAPSYKLTVEGAAGELVSIGTSTQKLYFYPDSAGSMLSTGAGQAGQGIYFGHTSNFMFFQTNATERMRITSGGTICINETSAGSEKLNVKQAGVAWGTVFNHTYSTQFWIDFRYNGTGVGNIVGNGSSVSFNSTSDYRLKEDFKMIKGIETLSKINFYDFKWKISNDRMSGVIAHELQEILPYAVFGVKDGKDMQAVDYSKLTPVIGRAVQELNYKFETQAEKIARLETRVQQLEAK